MKKFMKVLVGVCALMLLFDECQSAGMHKLPRRKSNSERDYGLLGNFITAMVDRWYAPPQAPREEGTDTQAATKAKAVAPQPVRKSVKENPKSRGKTSKQAKVKAEPKPLVFSYVGEVEPGGRDKDYGLLGNLLVYLVDLYNGVDPSTLRPSDSGSHTDGTGTTKNSPTPEESSIAAGTSAKESQQGALPVDDEDIDLWDDEESDREEDKSDSSNSLCKMSPAERLKHLLEPFVLNLMVDDGGLRDAVEKLRAWEAQERYENLNYIGGGIAAL